MGPEVGKEPKNKAAAVSLVCRLSMCFLSLSLSSIEGSVTPKPPPSALCPRTNETYVVEGEGGGGEEGNVAKTPKSTKKGRRSLIPTPKGQVRGSWIVERASITLVLCSMNNAASDNSCGIGLGTRFPLPSF